MARVFTPQDCHVLIDAISEQITGQAVITGVDTHSFVSVGETILAAGTENVLNAISLVLGRTFMAVRPYEAKLKIINALNSGLFANRLRKISFYSRKAQPSGAFNTDLYTNEAQGYDNGSNGGASTASMWAQNPPMPLEMNFGGRSTWQDSTTVYEWQLQAAFRSEENFADFMAGIMTEKGNDIETQKEAFNRATLLNYMAGIYDLNTYNGGAAIDLADAFNAEMNTAYSRQSLLTTHYKEFLEFVVAMIKKISNLLENRSAKWHLPMTKTISGVDYNILRHTPKSKQRLIMYRPFWIDAEARVFPEIFNDQYLKPEAYEGVDYWQSEGDPTMISVVTPAIPDTNNPSSQTYGNNVELDYVLGVLYDEDAVMIDYQLDTARSTPVEARKGYSNIWWTFAKNAINDFTENGVLLYIGPGEEEGE